MELQTAVVSMSYSEFETLTEQVQTIDQGASLAGEAAEMEERGGRGETTFHGDGVNFLLAFAFTALGISAQGPITNRAPG